MKVKVLVGAEKCVARCAASLGVHLRYIYKVEIYRVPIERVPILEVIVSSLLLVAITSLLIDSIFYFNFVELIINLNNFVYYFLILN